MADIFISYSSEDKRKVELIAGILKQKGWTVWWDRDIPAGKRFDAVIEEELGKALCVIVIWTQRSVNSEWVKNEASEAVQQGILVPVMLEEVKIPLAFRRIEAARLINWNGEPGNLELGILINAVSDILNPGDKVSVTSQTSGEIKQNVDGRNHKNRSRFSRKAIIIITAFIVLVLIFIKLVLPGISTLKPVTLKILDRQKKPVIQGAVKLYMPDYTLSRAIDNKGEAQFKDIPNNSTIRIEVSSEGYTKYTVDTVLPPGHTIELVLSPLRLVHISGRVKTAAEVPVKNVEVNVDGTKYYDQSVTDGTYSIQLKGYTVGDNITITASGDKNYTDKTIPIKINGPEMIVDFVLDPVHH